MKLVLIFAAFASLGYAQVPVQWFGAKCDGVADDHAAIQAALNTATAVEFSGTCLTTVTLTTAVDGQLILGRGTGDTSAGISIIKADGRVKAIQSAIPHSGNAGTGYSVGDIVTVTETLASGGELTVTSIGGGGAVTGVYPLSGNQGTGYTVTTALVTTGGTGTGLKVDTIAVGLAGPVLAIQHNGVRLSNLVVDGNAGAADYGVTAACANSGVISDVLIRNSQNDNLRITNTDAAWTGCADGPNNNGLIVQNSLITGSVAGPGIHITGAVGDVNNNLIQFNGLRVVDNYQDGLCGTGSQNQVNGGNYSNNGANPGTTQYYGLRLSCPGDVVSAQHWQVNNIDPESSNFNTSSMLYRGPLIYFGTYSQQNTLYTSGASIAEYCNNPGCYFYTVGSDRWTTQTPGGFQDIVGTGVPEDINYAIYDHNYGVGHPVWAIQGTSGGNILALVPHSGSAGTGYITGDQIFVVQGGGGGGYANVTASAGVVTSLTLRSEPGSLGIGYGYVTATNLSTTGGTGTGLAVDVTAAYHGNHAPLAPPLAANCYGLSADSYCGLVTMTGYGEMGYTASSQTSVCPATLTASGNIPTACVHQLLDSTASGFIAYLSSGPLLGETHTLVVKTFGAGHSITVEGQGYNINLVGGSATPLTNFFTAVNQSLTVRYNGASWDVVSYYH